MEAGVDPTASLGQAAPAAPSFSEEATRVSGRRYLAHVADGLVYTLIAIAFLIPAAVISNTVLAIALVIWLTVGQIAYFVLTQRRSGRSPGKHMTGLKVVDAAGAVPTDGALVRRSIPLIFEYFYVIAWASMMGSPYRQRLGDRWAHTYVIDVDAGAAGDR